MPQKFIYIVRWMCCNILYIKVVNDSVPNICNLDQFGNFFLRFCNFVKFNFLQNASSVRITYSGVSYQSNYINEYVTLYRPVSIRLSISIWIIYEMVSYDFLFAKYRVFWGPGSLRTGYFDDRGQGFNENLGRWQE